jgi:succinylglutamate desuccinylase
MPQPPEPAGAGAAAARAAAEEAAAGRVLGRVGPAGGAVLVCVAGLHGNEPAGVVGLATVIERLESDPEGLQGELVGLLGNRCALVEGKRYLRRDLNRMWQPERLRRLRAGGVPEGPEEDELRDLDRELSPLLAGAAEGRLCVLDLHTTSAPGPAFAVLDDTLANRAFALGLGVPLVLGLEEELGGPLLHYLVDRGAVAAGFESGQHLDPAAVDAAAAAVWLALEASGVLAPGSRPEPVAARRLLAAGAAGLPRVTEVVYRHPVVPGDGFAMAPGFLGFEPVDAGQALGRDRGGGIAAPRRGRLLMPLYQSQGEDGYFLVRDVRPLWLRLSTVLRRLRLERWLHLLPGVCRHPEQAGTFVVDRRVARWYALEVFHLLGFRRHGGPGRELVVSRRVESGTW